MILIGLVLIGKLFTLQVIEHDHYTTLSQYNRVKIQPLPPIRGRIFSRDNVLFADNRTSFSLELVPDGIDNIEQVIRELQELVNIDEQDIKQFRKQLKKQRRFESIPLRLGLTDEEIAKISVNQHRYPGVDVVAKINRYYPLGANLAHVVGYVGMISKKELSQIDAANYCGTSHIGKSGVEKTYENLLHGYVGYQQVEVNAQGRVIRVLDRVPSKPGKNVYLTLDISLQNLAVSALEGEKGAIVAIDPRNGDLLVLVSSPSYNPNLFVDGIDYDSYNKLLNSSNAPLLNRALQGEYPPGSTIKPFIGLAALELGLRDPFGEIYCRGWFSLAGQKRRFRDWKRQGHGKTNMTQAISKSCDVYFYSLAHEMGIDKLQASLKQFGFGKVTDLDINAESAGLIPSREWKRRTQGQVWYPGETINAGIGQGAILVTPIQLASATVTLINRGKAIEPHLFAEARDAVSNETSDISIPVSKQALIASRHEYWDIVINAMIEVVHGISGTARGSSKGAKYRYGGKTGTAQVFSLSQDETIDEEDIPQELRSHALFIAFAPVKNPSIVISIIVENGGNGSVAAAPIARRLLDLYFKNLEQNQD